MSKLTRRLLAAMLLGVLVYGAFALYTGIDRVGRDDSGQRHHRRARDGRRRQRDHARRAARHRRCRESRAHAPAHSD